MILSKHNIFSKIRDSENYFIVNLLTGNADILSAEEATIFSSVMKGHDLSMQDEYLKEYIEKGYITDEKKEAGLYRNKYLDFIDSREDDEIQLFFVPDYTCNFSCSYCYQDEYQTGTGRDLPSQNYDMINAFFKYINLNFGSRKKYITLFGGEPLLNSEPRRELIKYFIEGANRNNLDICVVTNGYNLPDYIEILKKGKIREVQVTLDGTQEIHDSRRHLKGGGKTFERIVEGIERCLENNISINLRVVIDKENIENLPEIAGFAINKGWTKNPLFKTQIGRNYELHHCQSAPDKLFSRISLYEKLFELIKKYPEITEFYKPAYSISRFLFENGEMPEPLFDSCPACKTEWAFDYTGKIYPCTATVGKTEEAIGAFYPEVTVNEKQISKWEERDVTSISECSDCSLQLACGGGCGSVAKNKNGKIDAPDCRPVKELMELGFAAYFSNQLSVAGNQ